VVRIRLRRIGAKKSPYYRIVVTDKRSPRDGRFIEAIGTYDPNTKPETVTLEIDRAAHWLANGAQASDGAIRILQRAKLVDENGKAIPYTPADTGVAGAVA
jgi:small subunit ribosomal protein S16